MSRATQVNQPGDAGGDDPLDEVVAACIESGSDDLESAVERACLRHPGSADEIRRRIDLLRKVGMLRPSGVGSDQRFPEQLGEFRLLERLGGGGMGVVFRARQETLGREVALKLIRPEHLYFPQARERFRRETEAAARLQHPGLVPIFTVGEDHGLPFFAMELVHGSTLAEALRELRTQGPERLQGRDLERALRSCSPAWTSWNDAAVATAFEGSYADSIVRLILQVADALHHAHSRGVLHRDVKPSNIAVTREGRALLFDFGLASLGQVAGRTTLTRGEIGSLYYMSPEQLRGRSEAIDRRSDLYSLGVTLYEALALQVPFAASDPDDTRRAILEGAARPLRALNRAVPRDLELVCAKAMERDAARRYDDVAAFARDLRNVLEHRPIEARPPSTALQVRRWVARHPLASTALAAAITLPSVMYWQQSTHSRELGAALTDANNQRATAQLESRDARAVDKFLIDLFAAADPSMARGREYTARELLDHAAKRLETELVDQPLVRASLLQAIGESYTSLGAWDQAEATLGRALELRQSAAGERSIEVADSLTALAALESQLGRPTALEHARRAIELRHDLASEPTFEFANALVAYGLILTEAHQFEDAHRAFDEARAILDRAPGDQRLTRAEVLANIALLWKDQNQLEDAVKASREALAAFAAIDDLPHPSATACRNTLALALTGLGRYDEARPLYDDLLREESQLTGEQSTRFATFLASKSNVELRTGHTAYAIELLERASGSFARIAPATHDAAIQTGFLLALAYQRAARWNEALATLQALAAPIESTSGPSSMLALKRHVLVALSDEALGDCKAMESVLTDALERAERAAIPEDDGWETIGCAVLARCLARRGDIAGAQAMVERARGVRNDPELKLAEGAWTRLAAGTIAQDANDFEAARAQFEPLAAKDEGPIYGEVTPAIARAHLAVVLAGSDATRSRELATSARAELEAQLGSEHPETRALVEFLGTLH
jgi:serine/threonine protein kinase